MRQWITDAVNWVVSNFRGFFRSYLSPPVRGAMELIQTTLEAIPPGLFLVGIFLIGWRAASWRVGLFSFIALALAGFMGVWNAWW
ncbi:hypothetical protein [Halomonas sp. BC04]|uniref:hypothetical protein n=1 Tax=Halomonas sp. BC04 TaxID=1403540 RepID=UPI0003ED67F6|nr:hypothetical protein [Halomonas sp. BC04]EWG99443.1 hypothetical protein Q427_24900 [Halomonas sp. BC04]